MLVHNNSKILGQPTLGEERAFPCSIHPSRFIPIRKKHNIGIATGLLLTLLVIVASPISAAQTTGEADVPDRIALFLDCEFCDEDFVRQEMTYVDYVRNREVADVHVLVTRQPTGAGGDAFTADLFGQGPFEGMDYSTVFTTNVGATEDEVRTSFLRRLQATLVPYLLKTSLASRLIVEVEEAETLRHDARQVDDRWNSWTFELYADGDADFESSQRAFDTRYGLVVDRVTEEWKIRLRPFFNYEYQRFERGDEIITSTTRRDGVTTYVVRSVSPHWSVGGFADVFTSTFDNVERRFRFMPAIEYSIFPYRLATRRQLTFAYRIGGSHITFIDTTIYGETEQLLPEHSLDAGYRVRQPWGEIDIGMEARQYLHDPDFYSVEFGGGFEVRLFQGLSVGIGGEVVLIHNQLNLPKGDASLEEVLLRQRQLETNFELGLSFGLRYRFGSIYNNVVNPRFIGGRNQDQF